MSHEISTLIEVIGVIILIILSAILITAMIISLFK